MGARFLIIVACLSACLVGCDKRSEKYCLYHPEELAFCPRTDGPAQGPKTCGTAADCPPTAPICDPIAHICAECESNADCTAPDRAICDPSTLTCTACAKHSDCASNACLPDDTCGDDSSVIYVDGVGPDNAACSHAAPCKTLLHGIALLSTTRKYIKLRGHLTEPSVTIVKQHATILADPGTTFTGAMDPAIKIQMSEIKIYDLTIACPAAAIGGIKSEMSSTTTLQRVTITGCGHVGLEGKGGYLRVNRCTIAKNLGGGIVLDMAAAFSITNNFIYLNGKPDGPGGVVIGSATSGVNQFEFNTVAGNAAKMVGGVSCPTTNTLATNNNLIVGNTGAKPNTVGCDFSNSIIDTDISQYAFVGPEDFHLTAASPVRDSVTASSTVIDDIDGQFRPLGSAKDFGADEYKP